MTVRNFVEEEMFTGLKEPSRILMRQLYRHFRTGYYPTDVNDQRRGRRVYPKSIDESRYLTVIAINLIKRRSDDEHPRDANNKILRGPNAAGPPLKGNKYRKKKTGGTNDN